MQDDSECVAPYKRRLAALQKEETELLQDLRGLRALHAELARKEELHLAVFRARVDRSECTLASACQEFQRITRQCDELVGIVEGATASVEQARLVPQSLPPDVRVELMARDVERRVLVDLSMGYREGMHRLWFSWLCPALTGMVNAARAALDAETRRPGAPPLADLLAGITLAEEKHGSGSDALLYFSLRRGSAAATRQCIG
jgi:hypothetical protein